MTLDKQTQWIASAQRALAVERDGLQTLEHAMSAGLGQSFARAVAMIITSQARVIVSGMGKSGHIGRKIAATLSSTGTPAYFVHPAEASHGDLGMITASDVILAISNSGESAELHSILAYAKRFKVPLIAMTGSANSTLGREADVVLELPKAQEACPNGQAPTTSTLLQLALGDALAMALLEDKGFTAKDFQAFHPGGKLGAQLKLVGDIMHRSEALPLVATGTEMSDALLVMTGKSFGCLGVQDREGQLVGIITDGDLRRHMGPGLMSQTVDAIMTLAPTFITTDVLAVEALELLNAKRITSVFVVDADGKPVGLIHIHDLLRIGVG